ncbi:MULTISPECIES: O-antigen ligase family protein [unclassified Pseudomonas]|uniref:O-antigen ligase family protein n=1 Tax=unclassified Pseudomonas TaxID=196821 RepID=UPI0002707CC6|nr:MULTISPECIES: O-antigen ligase family protein [unclassified Pseudomonas]EJM90700.1 O-Antigen ligase [Pseudomonas sp. GM67]MBD9545888.1 O-antigen ligase family protein [Pseudomonas sp. PDM01]
MVLNTMIRIKNSAAIIIAALTAIGLTQENDTILFMAATGMASVIIMAGFSPWLGMLTLFPLALALPPAPATVGLQEFSFAVLLAVITTGTFIECLHSPAARPHLKLWGLTILVVSTAITINLTVALNNNIPLRDWTRGTIPFLFMLNFLPVAVLIGKDGNRIRWIGISIATSIFMLAGFIIFYYFHSDLWRPYWLLSVDDQALRIPETVASEYADAIGPMRDRITMSIAQATDALLPVGLVIGVTLASLAQPKAAATTGLLMALSCMIAILITFTRSMLLSSLLAMFIFLVYLIVYRKEVLPRFITTLTALGAAGLIFIYSTGIQDIWIGRMSQLIALPTSELNTTPVDTIVEPDALISTTALSTPEQNISTETTPNDTSTFEAPPAPDNYRSIQPEVFSDNKITKDFNISARMDEYKIAWEMFVPHPIMGNGLGVKHEMRWETSDNVSEAKQVAYVHNWPFYMLMVGGLSGLLVYSALLFGPVIFKLSSIRSEPIHWTLIRMAILTMAIYGAFFAVFRLITFNLLLAVIWGILVTQVLIDRQKNKSEIDNT